MTMRIWRHTLRAALLTATMSAAVVGCGAQDDEAAMDEEATVAAQVATRPQGSAKTATCAAQYASCLLGAWDDVLTPAGLTPLTKCTREAEACGLFENAPDAGTGVSPTCGFEIADCYLKNPRDPGKCRALPCRSDAGAPSRTK